MKRSEAIEAIKDLCRLKHYSLATEQNYSHWVGRFFLWLQRHHGEVADTPAARMEGYLTALAKENVSASTQNQAFSAILFFYRHVMKQEPGKVDALRAKRPKFLRHAPPREEVLKVLSAVRDSPAYPFQLILFLLYGCGLRVSEPLGVRIRDLDLGNRRMIIRQAKGSKDRMVPIPELLIPAIQRQIQASRTVWQRSVAEGVPVQLPGQLGRKYRNAGHEFGWWWLFPMENGCVDPRTKVDTTITPHHLRHAWATHVIDDGARIRDVQEILGHKSLETTMIYVHDEIERVKSPLDATKTLRLMGGAA